MTSKEPGTTFPYIADVAFQTGDIVFATDRLGRVVYWNKEAEAISGYKAEEVLGKPYTLACRMEPGAGVADLAAILGGQDFAGGVRCHPRSGGDAALYLFATVGRNRAGEPAGVVFVGRDVTGLWRAEETAQASADKYRVLFENTLDSVAIAYMDGRVLEANPAYLRMYGYTADDVKGMNLADVVTPEDRGAAAKAMASLASGRHVARTIRALRKDGTRFVADYASSVMSIGGERRIMSVARDVTERVRAEQALNQSERMYRAVFESANDAVFIESVDGRILDVNRNGCELLGYQRDELVKMSVSDLVPAEARAWLPHVTDAILRDGTFRTEAVRVHKGGRHIPVDLSASAMELDGRTVVLAIVRDITERKQAEQVLRESEEKFRSVSEQSPNMIFINSRGRVVYANQKSSVVMGYTREEFYAPGFDFMRLFAPDSVEQIKAVYARHARGEDVEPYEYALVTKDGRRIESIITTNLIDYDGTKAILGIVTDITARKQTEQALRESEENFRALAENASDGVTIGDEHGRHVFANRRAAEILGYSVEQLLEMTFREFLPPGDRQMLEERFARRSRGEEVPTQYDLTIMRRDGSAVPVEVGVSQTKWHGRPAQMVMLHDISERLRADQALATTEERYRNLVESSPDGIAVYQDGVVVLANRASAELLGYSDGAELVGRTAAGFVTPEDLPRVEERTELLRTGGKTTGPLLVRFLNREGGSIPAEVVGAITTWHGKPAVQIMVRPLSARRG